MLTSIIPQCKGQFKISGDRKALAEHLRKVGGAVGSLDIDVYSFRMARLIWKMEAYVVSGSIRNIGDGYIIDYHIHNHWLVRWVWWIAIPGNLILLLLSDQDIATHAGLAFLPTGVRYFIYLAFIVLAMKIFSWLVLSDMAITEKILCDIPLRQQPERLAEGEVNGK